MTFRGFSFLPAALAALAGCNAIFGISGGQPLEGAGGASSSATTGTSTSTSASTSTSTSTGAGGGCNVYGGVGMTYYKDVGDAGANMPTLSMGNDGSITGTYYAQGGYSELKLGANVNGFCGIGTLVDISGLPQVGDYTVVSTSPYTDASFSSGPKNAYVFASGDLQLPDGGCDPNVIAFGSVAGTGKVSISEVQGMTVKFTVTGVLANGITDPMCAGMGVPCDGQGTIQVDVKGGESDCFQMN